MAEARIACLMSARTLGPETRLLEFSLVDGQTLGFTGGQYVIVNTGVPLSGGKVAKRAYSILSSDRNQERFQIAVRRIGAGPGSTFMHEMPVGSAIPFSGPWGKYLVAPDAEPGRTLVLATDTGLTAALGLIRGAPFARLLPETRVLWFVESREYFLPESWLAGAVPDGCEAFTTRLGPPIHHGERVAAARSLLASYLDEGLPAHVFLSGDGAILYPLCQDLAEAGLAENQIRLECFFNNPQRRAP
jgi:ferredoxin-NADP reductase